MKDVISIDGPSGSGKSTVSKILARELGYRYLDTGALYRAVAWKARHDHISLEDKEGLRHMLRDMDISFEGERIMVNGRDISGEIRTQEIGELSSRVSSLPLVREHLFALQRNMALKGKAVIEGRDIGTNIIPESENKFYLDASVEVRAARRHREFADKAGGTTLESTVEAIQKRDSRDASRNNAPLQKTEDMVYVNTTGLSIEEVVDKILGALKRV